MKANHRRFLDARFLYYQNLGAEIISFCFAYSEKIPVSDEIIPTRRRKPFVPGIYMEAS